MKLGTVHGLCRSHFVTLTVLSPHSLVNKPETAPMGPVTSMKIMPSEKICTPEPEK